MQVKFSDPSHQAHYDEKGYVIVDLLSQEELARCRSLAERHIPTDAKGIYTNVFFLSYEDNMAIGHELADIFLPHLERALPGYMTLAATFIVKGAEPENTHFCLHQDATVVDEHTHTTLGLWVPVVDTHRENGGLCVLPGSNRGNPFTIRSAHSPSLEIEIDEEVEPYVEYLDIKAGQGIIFSHQLFHGSPSNLSGKQRPIIHAGLVPVGVQHKYYMIDRSGQKRVLETPLDFYYNGLREVIQGDIPSNTRIIADLDEFPPRLTREFVMENTRKRLGNRPPAPKPMPAQEENPTPQQESGFLGKWLKKLGF
jgi:hypothetical protein